MTLAPPLAFAPLRTSAVVGRGVPIAGIATPPVDVGAITSLPQPPMRRDATVALAGVRAMLALGMISIITRSPYVTRAPATGVSVRAALGGCTLVAVSIRAVGGAD